MSATYGNGPTFVSILMSGGPFKCAACDSIGTHTDAMTPIATTHTAKIPMTTLL